MLYCPIIPPFQYSTVPPFPGPFVAAEGWMMRNKANSLATPRAKQSQFCWRGLPGTGSGCAKQSQSAGFGLWPSCAGWAGPRMCLNIVAAHPPVMSSEAQSRHLPADEAHLSVPGSPLDYARGDREAMFRHKTWSHTGLCRPEDRACVFCRDRVLWGGRRRRGAQTGAAIKIVGPAGNQSQKNSDRTIECKDAETACEGAGNR